MSLLLAAIIAFYVGAGIALAWREAESVFHMLGR